MSKPSAAFKVIRGVLCAIFCVFALLPVYAALIVALTPYANMLEPQLFPHYFAIGNFWEAFLSIGRNVLNSFLYAAFATVLTTVIAVPAAYCLARYRFAGRKAVSFALMLTQMMAGIVVLPTLYKILNGLGLLNSRAVLVVVFAAFNLALVVTILQGYFATLPTGLDEAAAIDGCNYLDVLVRIILPVSGPGIAVGAIFVFVNSYNDFVIPLFLLSNANHHPLAYHGGGVSDRDSSSGGAVHLLPEVHHSGRHHRRSEGVRIAMDSVLNAAVIGCGAIARKKHIPLAAANSHVHIKALCSRSRAPAEVCKAEFGCADAAVYGNAEDVFARDDIDLVFLCTPNDTHADYAVRAMESGKHVICEKPMASRLTDAERMWASSQRCGKMLHISYQNRYTDQALYTKRLIDEGILGDIYYVKAYALRRRAVPTWGAAGRKTQGGGPLMDIGSHAIDLALWLSGCFAPEHAMGTAYDRIGRRGSAANHWGSWDPEEYEVEDLAVGLVRMKNGMTLSIEASYALNVVEEKEASVDLFGTAAGLELCQTDGVAIVQELGDRMVISRTDIQHTFRGLTPGAVPRSPSQREHDAVVAMLLDGATVDPAAEQALAVARIVDGIYRSASAGCGISF